MGLCSKCLTTRLQDLFLNEASTCVFFLFFGTVDGSEIPNNYLGCIRSPVNDGIFTISTGSLGFLNHQQKDLSLESVKSWFFEGRYGSLVLPRKAGGTPKGSLHFLAMNEITCFKRA